MVDDLFDASEPVRKAKDLARNGVFDDGEVEQFLADLYATRTSDLARQSRRVILHTDVASVSIKQQLPSTVLREIIGAIVKTCGWCDDAARRRGDAGH